MVDNKKVLFLSASFIASKKLLIVIEQLQVKFLVLQPFITLPRTIHHCRITRRCQTKRTKLRFMVHGCVAVVV